MRVCTSLKAAFSLSARLDSTICAVYVSVFTVCSPCASERARISVGLWAHSADAQARVSAAAGIPAARSRAWFEASFGASMPARTITAA